MRKIAFGLFTCLLSLGFSGSTCLPPPADDAGIPDAGNTDAGDTPVDAGEDPIEADAGEEDSGVDPQPTDCTVAVAELGFTQECNECLLNSCCSEISTCYDNGDCWNTCLIDPNDSVCTAGAGAAATAFEGLAGCYSDNCAGLCDGPPPINITPSCDALPANLSNGSCITLGDAVECNPVTNEGCPADGSVCDFSSGGFTCYPPPNDAGLCQACDNTNNIFCGAGLTCANNQCVHFCCADSDCGTGGCDFSFSNGAGYGLCVAADLLPE